MKLTKVLTGVRAKRLWYLFLLGLKNPWFVVPTFFATKDCVKISTRHFGRKHYQNGPANAFRHAFWNYLIAKRCTVWSKNEQKVMHWTKEITDWHEETFQNEPLARKMDYHNNLVGRNIFSVHNGNNESEVVEILCDMASQSKKIDVGTDLTKLNEQLVHIID